MVYFCDNERHLICIPYSIENLHKMAKELNIKKCWFHKNHYDIPKKRQEEIKSKCLNVSTKTIVDLIKSSMKNFKLERLQNGESFVTSEKGNSMTPILKSGQEHRLSPATWEQVEVDDVVYCKVKGHFYTHLVKAKNDDKGCLIGNNRGGTNGWTKQIYGKVTEIL